MLTVRLTKMVENGTIRFHLSRTITMRCPPQPGWFIAGYTDCPAVQLIVAKVGWNKGRAGGLIECVLEEKKLDVDDNVALRAYLKESYGAGWAMVEIHLTLDGAKRLLDEHKGEHSDKLNKD